MSKEIILDYLQKASVYADTLEDDLTVDLDFEKEYNKYISQLTFKLQKKNIKTYTSNDKNNDAVNAKNNAAALEAIMNQLIDYAEFNFTNQLNLEDDNELIHTIATTVNLLGEELEDKILKLQETTMLAQIETSKLEAITNALDNSALVSLTDLDGRITKVNKAFCEISKYTEAELIGQDHRLVNSHFHPKSFWADMWRTIANGKTWRAEVKNRAKDGTEYWVDTVINPVLDTNQKISHYLSIRNIITEKKYQEQIILDREKSIHEALNEKQVLLQEVHHRVKNNLQIIAGLIDLQIKRTISSEVLLQLVESQKRIRTIALVHEKLYQSNSMSRINISEYTQSLIISIGGMYDEKKRSMIRIKQDIEEDIYLNIDKAIPYGLVFNEIFSNCFKHGFTENTLGSIIVSLISVDKTIQLRIKDSGVGMSEDFNLKTAKTLGLKLINSLSKQLRGTLSFENQNGLLVRLDFENN